MDKIYENRNIKDLDGEIWKYIEGYNRDYQVSNLGRIKSFKKCRGKDKNILKQTKMNNGYLSVGLSKNGKKGPKEIHRLMFETFNNYKLEKGEVIHHLNENPLYNDLDNFQLMTNSEHMSLHNSGENHPFYGKKRPEFSGENNPMFGKKRSDVSKRMSGENHPQVVLTERDIIQIKRYLSEGNLSQKEIGKMFGVNQATISNIKTGKSWKHLK